MSLDAHLSKLPKPACLTTPMILNSYCYSALNASYAVYMAVFGNCIGNTRPCAFHLISLPTCSEPCWSPGLYRRYNVTACPSLSCLASSMCILEVRTLHAREEHRITRAIWYSTLSACRDVSLPTLSLAEANVIRRAPQLTVRSANKHS